MTTEHSGRVAIVTGGASGLGRGIAQRLRAEGATVAVFDLNPVPSEAEAAGPTWSKLVDVSDEARVEAATSEVRERFGRIDYLVCCAGIYPYRPFLALTPQEFARTLAVNLTGSFLCCRAALGPMLDQRFGRMVLFSSTVARTGAVNSAHYAASKGGVLGLARSLALEVADRNIRINTLSPGLTDTPQPRGHLSEAELQARASKIPLGRIGRVDDMVEACLFLLSDESSFLTGQDLRVNGGATLF